MTGAQAPSGATALLNDMAASLDDEARRHKRAADYHRRQAQLARQRLQRLAATCQALGIRLVVVDQDHGHSPEGIDR